MQLALVHLDAKEDNLDKMETRIHATYQMVQWYSGTSTWYGGTVLLVQYLVGVGLYQ